MLAAYFNLLIFKNTFGSGTYIALVLAVAAFACRRCVRRWRPATQEQTMNRRLSSEDLDWLCRIGIARSTNEPLKGIPESVARQLTMLHCAQIDSHGEYSLLPPVHKPGVKTG